jgi:hypothetical protein
MKLVQAAYHLKIKSLVDLTCKAMVDTNNEEQDIIRFNIFAILRMTPVQRRRK